ncbi:hypothetical protein QN277_025612 [Acacia crassicarpa]|uniref:Uncharacterized protein n=1 Tax=Acacia crassicarpa TaxID=499986 RepID=A0AAE1J9H5_9FABA|nr:hypothetical protein QN277_025612 [Acacia crassicarpa]
MRKARFPKGNSTYLVEIMGFQTGDLAEEKWRDKESSAPMVTLTNKGGPKVEGAAGKRKHDVVQGCLEKRESLKMDTGKRGSRKIECGNLSEKRITLNNTKSNNSRE